MRLAAPWRAGGSPGTDPQRFYYLHNFKAMLATLERRDGDLLNAEEARFMQEFATLPTESQGLLVRMAMRKGDMFRASRLVYDEIADVAAAARPLLRLAWLDDRPALSAAQLFRLFTKAELAQRLGFPAPWAREPKSMQLARCQESQPQPQPLERWFQSQETVYALRVSETCERLRLMYFGNFRQDLSEFVLATLGVFKYECPVTPESRPFATRRQVEDFHQLYRCRELLHAGIEPAVVESALPTAIEDCEWLEERRQKLKFQIGRGYERAGETQRAALLYESSTYPAAAGRARVLARRAAGRPVRREPAAHVHVPTFDLELAMSPLAASVESQAALHLEGSEAGSRVHYVENALINSLFGLLCWPALFAPLPGAFFHPFHHGPADFGTPGFAHRRRGEFAACFAELGAGSYKTTITRRFHDKHGIGSPFIAWVLLSEPLLSLALECFPAAHLLAWFEWMLVDLRSNRSGFPDLVQFWPQTRTYRLIEVKAPGDRLQDSQRRYMEFAVGRGMPVSVCRVSWRDPMNSSFTT